MVTTVRIKEGGYGMMYEFTVEDADLSAYDAKLYVRRGNELIINGEGCTVRASGDDTIVEYIVQDGDFDDVGKYKAEIAFYADDYNEPVKTFYWVVDEAVSEV